MGDPWEVYAFDELHCGHGLHQDTLLGNSDAIAGATLTALWAFLLPIFKQQLNRRKQQKMVKVYFFLALCLHPVFPTDNDFSALASLGSGKDLNIRRCIL